MIDSHAYGAIIFIILLLSISLSQGGKGGCLICDLITEVNRISDLFGTCKMLRRCLILIGFCYSKFHIICLIAR